MKKPDRENDTEPMPGPPVDRTDPGPPPEVEHQSLTPVPTDDEVSETEHLLQQFNRPLRPPAPRPKQQASSDGGDFVAYSSVASPARSSVEEMRRVALVEIANLASAPDASRPDALLAGQRDLSTFVGTSSRSRLSAVQKVAVGAVVLVGLAGVLAVVAARATPSAPAAPPALSEARATVAITPPVLSVTSAASTAQLPEPPPPSASPAATEAPPTPRRAVPAPARAVHSGRRPATPFEAW